MKRPCPVDIESCHVYLSRAEATIRFYFILIVPVKVVFMISTFLSVVQNLLQLI